MLLTVWTLGDEIWENPHSGSTRDLKNGDLTAGQDQRTDLRPSNYAMISIYQSKSLILQSIFTVSQNQSRFFILLTF